MSRYKIFLIWIVAASLALSCAASISRGGEFGSITVNFAPSSARALATGWPDESIPAFSSVTVKVSASDMSTVTVTAPGVAGSLSIQVPAGSNRLVELTAVPTAGGSAPVFAKSYYGSATADIGEGQTTSVTIKLTLSESKLILPGYENSEAPFTIRIADSLKSGITGTLAENPEGLALDQYGRLFISGVDGYIRRYTSLTGEPEAIGPFEVDPGALAYDAGRNRLYANPHYGQESAPQLLVTNLSDSVIEFRTVMIPEGYSLDQDFFPLAVDGDGYVYIGLFKNVEETFGIAKLAVTDTGQDFVPSSVVGFAPDFGRTGMAIGAVSDLTVKDGILYLALIDLSYGMYPEYLYSRGKIVAVDASTMDKLWETGWAGDEARFPSPEDRNKRFSGPLLFVGVAPKKLYVADNGFYWGGGTKSGYLENVSRVIEVDLDTQAITDIGLDGTIFIEDFSTQFVYGTDMQYG